MRFHWFDGERAVAEIHRVLRPGGVLALIWNRRDLRDDLQAQLSALLEPHRGAVPAHREEAWRAPFRDGALFGALREETFADEQVVDAGGLAVLPGRRRRSHGSGFSRSRRQSRRRPSYICPGRNLHIQPSLPPVISNERSLMVTARRRRCRTATALLRSIHLRRNAVVAIAIAATVLVAPSAGAKTTYRQLAAGDGYTCGLTKAGRIVCKGYNRYGQTNVPRGRYRAVDAGPFSLTCALTRARHARCWGFGSSGEKKPPRTGRYAKIAAGNGLACAMTTAGKVRCWGRAARGATTPAGTFRQISAGDGAACGLTKAARIRCWGTTGHPLLDAPAGTFTQISLNYSHACAIATDGRLACWGNADAGADQPPAGSFRQVAVAARHACALSPAGRAVCWGARAKSTNAPRTPFRQISAGNTHTCGLTRTGRAVCWGARRASL